MQFKIEGKCVLTLEHKPGEMTSKHVTTDFNLNVSDNVDRSNFLTPDDLPTAAGTKALSQCFIQGLVGNIHQAHKEGYWDSAEHLRYIIAELERGFATVANTYPSTF